MTISPTIYSKEAFTIDDSVKSSNIQSMRSTNSKNIYRGFSTTVKGGKSFRMTDKELVQRDLLNHIYTIPGERIGRPNFGTLIPMIAFEPATPETLKLVERELRRVVDSDPRVKLVDIAVVAMPDNNAILAALDLLYVELDGEVETLSITIANE